ncbi:hypothetical protein PSN45_005174 [Yamadazyma tenuis]|uniref:NAD-dependent epimerase/dehydratase domain-containing protein n=1 Tax=Candida tenuis (strain ATCC 10573 / BCRC 21748 / CBS 615 / JCM 9827 / NBRC 10315 / NRRL Y-1498 / VKM Y-70) TaxID=590646 RepID=G3B0W9_CANTC|nr:uncharacterized protein CANTEDRAFT_134130 [Yamadazyma tenuis ATCC 10573]EGV64828.1 hypothetical protein CANTEDRAFT_134130 [Yamadazyma tenuis ATCC 10573]WEJ97618.1 hypothetical protein PSN45_005174 [Yamadazyma tenuis]
MTIPISVSPGSKVLVTGATGFIGAHCVQQLLDRGYEVKTAARSKNKFNTLKACFEEHHQSKLSFALVSDIGNYEQLVEAVKDCDGVLHLASPFSYTVTDMEAQLLKPAYDGTVTMLEASLTEPKVKRVIITSSFAAVYDASKGLQPDYVYTEKEFSPLTWEDGANTKDVSLAYRASKIVAEKAAWQFMEEKNPQFDLCVLCPTMVFGPLLSNQLFTTFEDLNLSNSVVWTIATSKEVPPTKGPLFVDVRDLAWAHVEALGSEAASNSRYLISAGDFDNQEIADILRESWSDKKLREGVPTGNPGHRLTGTHFKTDSSKAIAELGMTFRSLKESVLDLCDQLAEIHNRG